MPIRVHRKLRDELVSGDHPTVLFVVRSAESTALAAGMRAAREAIYRTTSPTYVTAPLPIPDGSLLMVDFGPATTDVRLTLLDTVTTALTDAGITDASIEPAPRRGDRWGPVERITPLSRAWLRGLDPPDHPRVLSRPPRPLMSAGRDWLLGERAADDELVALAVSVEVPLPVAEFDPIVDALTGSSAPLPHQTPVYATDFRTHGACAVFGALFGFGLLLSVGGGDLTAAMHRQRDLIRANTAHLDWAAIAAQPGDRNLSIPQAQVIEEADVPRPWYRLFSATELNRLGGPPPNSVTLPDGRIELTAATHA